MAGGRALIEGTARPDNQHRGTLEVEQALAEALVHDAERGSGGDTCLCGPSCWNSFTVIMATVARCAPTVRDVQARRGRLAARTRDLERGDRQCAPRPRRFLHRTERLSGGSCHQTTNCRIRPSQCPVAASPEQMIVPDISSGCKCPRVGGFNGLCGHRAGMECQYGRGAGRRTNARADRGNTARRARLGF